ncbi:glyceraldehyde-3-phosphate dehydrogenase [Antarctobacter sp.]
MTNRLAIIIGLLLVGAIVADLYLKDGSNLLFLGRKFFVLIDWLAFWR